MKNQRLFWYNLIRMAAVGALVLLPLGVQALDLAPDASRILSDPSFLPVGGELNGSSQFNISQLRYTNFNYLGAQQVSNSTETTTLNQLLEFGVTDDLCLRVSDIYQVQGATNNYASGASTVTTSTGFADPVFTAIWRFLDEKNNPLNWDLIGSYTPNLINAATGTQDQFGTVARGGSTAAGGSALSYETKGLTVYGEFLATYMDSRDVLNQATNVTTTYQPSWQYSLLIMTQTRFAEDWSLNAGVSQTYVDDADASFVSTTGKLFQFTNQPGNLTMLTASLNYQVTPGSFVASLLYSHDFYGDAGNVYSAFPKSDTTTSGKQADVFGAIARYAFN
jgi:hypothetical protein